MVSNKSMVGDNWSISINPILLEQFDAGRALFRIVHDGPSRMYKYQLFLPERGPSKIGTGRNRPIKSGQKTGGFVDRKRNSLFGGFRIPQSLYYLSEVNLGGTN